MLGLTQMIDLKLNQNNVNKQMKRGSKVRFREESVELYLPVVKHIAFFKKFLDATPNYLCFACQSRRVSRYSSYGDEHRKHEERRCDEFVKSYMRSYNFVVREVNDICCIIALDVDPFRETIHVNICAVEISK